MIKQIGLKDLPKETYLTFGKLIYDSEGDLIDIVESRELLLSIANDFRKKCSNIQKVSKEIGIPTHLIFKILKFKKKIRLEYLLKIIEFLEKNGTHKYNLEYLQNHIYAISSLHGRNFKPFLKINGKIERKLPFNFNTIEGVKCLTFPLSDGFILKGDDEYIRVGYTNSDITLHHDLNKNMESTFGDVSYSRRKVKAAYETYFTGIIGRIYTGCLGFKIGNKVKNNVPFPACLTSLKDPKLIGALVSQFIDDEGHFSNGTIDICIAVDKGKYAPNLLKDLKKLLAKICVNSHFRMPHSYIDKKQNKIKWTYHLQINGFGNITKLYPYLNIIKNSKRIGIQNHVNRLQIIHNKLKHDFSNGFQIQNIMTSFHISKQSAKNYLRTFQRAGLIKLVEKGMYVSNNGVVSYEQAKYQLS